MKPLARSRIFIARAAALALALLASPALLVNQASAVTYTWNGTTDRVWTTATNWDGGVVPVSANSTDIIISGNTNTGSMIISTVYTLKSLTFNATNTSDSALWLLASTNTNSASRNLTFSSNSGNATLTVESGSSGNKTIERYSGAATAPSQIILSSSLDVIHNGSGLLTLGKSLSDNGTYISGAGGINKSGTGTLILSGNNTYTGATTISAGTLKAGSTTGLSSSSAFTVGSGAVLDLVGFNNTISSFSTASAGTITDSSAAGSGGTLKVSTALSGTLTNLFTGSLGLNFVGNSILGNANNTYSGGTIYGASATASRWIGSGTIGTMSAGNVTRGILGTGAITFGLAATDKAQFYISGATTINNAIVVNTAAGDGTLGTFRVESWSALTLNGACLLYTSPSPRD